MLNEILQLYNNPNVFWILMGLSLVVLMIPRKKRG